MLAKEKGKKKTSKVRKFITKIIKKMYSFMVLSEPCQMKIYMLSKHHKCIGNGSAKLFLCASLVLSRYSIRINVVVVHSDTSETALLLLSHVKNNEGQLKISFSTNESKFSHYTHLFYFVDFQTTILSS